MTTFYPGVLSFADAQAITVETGQEQSGIEVRLLRGPVLSVKGNIPELQGPISRYQISAGIDFGFGWTGEEGKILPGGNFAFDGLPPGQHRLVLLEQGPNGPQRVGETNINLTGEDLSGIVITPFKPARIRVRVFFEGSEDKPLTTGSVFLYSATDREEEFESPGDQYSQLQPVNGTCVLDDVVPGKYKMGFTNASDGYLKSVEVGTQKVDTQSIVVNGGDVLEVTLTYSKSMAVVDGDIEVSEGPSKEGVKHFV